MPLCRINDDAGDPIWALYDNNRVCPLDRIIDDVPIGGEIYHRGVDWVASLPRPHDDQWLPAPSVLRPPVPAPQKCLCIGLNYRDHAIETNAPIPTEPVVFNKFPTALIGHGDSICLPKISKQVDFEAELVVVIGKAGRWIPVEQAMEHVFGYTCGHDVSARDWQKGRPGGQWLLGKTFDTFGPIGPCLVTSREVTDPGQLRIRMVINDVVAQDSSTDQLIFDIPTLIAHLSQIMTLTAGDLLFTGTPPGVGMARTPPVFLQHGDTCSVEIEHIGTLTNPCRNET
jgi:2-keto-4-pentenoate hydratase/2-oxohepta-3-ene-1,7-dioic acid hydratase in catechol pathway